MKKRRKIPIKYTDRDFNSIKASLIEHAKRYYPNTSKDFNEASFGALMTDQTAYVGDVLSFYTDYQANESFMDTAVEYENIIKHGRPLGYKFRGNPSAYGVATFYIIVPGMTTGLGPDPTLIPKLRRGSEFSTDSGVGFMLNADIDFSNANNEVVVAEVDDDTGAPLSYAIKAYGEVVSGELIEDIIEVGAYQQFLRLELAGDNITEVVSCIDSEGHEYFEVEYLSQDVIYKPVINRGSDADVAPAILKPVVVPRRYVAEQDENTTFIQFGYGTEDEIRSSAVVDPSTVVMQRHGRDYVSDDSFDPSKLLESDKFGVAPANTTMRVVYRNNTSETVNAAVDTLTQVVDPIFEFDNLPSLDSARVSSIINSLEITNDDPIVGDVSLPNTDELKRRILDTFPTQHRAVTVSDYKATVYSMPPQFGAIKRVNVVQDPDSFKRNLNMYLISENQNGTLAATSQTIKKNIKTWLAKNKMLNDTIDLLDAKVVNLGVEFDIVVDQDTNKYAVLQAAAIKLQQTFENHFDIGEPFDISRIYKDLNAIDGVIDTTRVRVVRKTGTGYGDINFNVDAFMSPDGRYIMAPKNVIFEVKYPGADVVGNIR